MKAWTKQKIILMNYVIFPLRLVFNDTEITYLILISAKFGSLLRTCQFSITQQFLCQLLSYSKEQPD